MHTLELNGKKVVIAQLSDSAHRYFLPIVLTSKYGQSLELEWNGVYHPLPEGSWRLHSTWPEMNKEQAKELVESAVFNDGGDFGMGITRYYRDYPDTLRDSCLFCPLESFSALLTSKRLPLTARYAILVSIPHPIK